MHKRKFIVAIMAAMCVVSMGVMNVNAAGPEADNNSVFNYQKNGNIGFVSLENTTSTQRWGSVSMIAYDAEAGIIGSDGANASLENGDVVQKTKDFYQPEKYVGSIRFSATLYYGNNPQGTPLSYWVRSIG